MHVTYLPLSWPLVDKKSLVESKNKWDKAKREVDKAKETVRMNKQKLERKLEEEDTTEQDLAEVERRQADAAHERMENATAMSVNPPSQDALLKYRNTSKKQSRGGRNSCF